MLQTVPPRELRGRVLGAWRTASTGWGLAGPSVLGLILQFAGARGGLIAGGVTVVALLALGRIAYRRWRTGDAAELSAPARQADFATAA
jgi:hypothetical protein